MKPVDQQVLHDAEHGIRGDCFRACLASILELPLSAVVEMGHDPEAWRRETNAWLAHLGLFYFDIRADDPMCEGLLHASPYHVIAGPSPRGGGVLHAVVGYHGVIEHDPHPSRAGLLGGERSYGFLLCQSPEVVVSALAAAEQERDRLRHWKEVALREHDKELRELNEREHDALSERNEARQCEELARAALAAETARAEMLQRELDATHRASLSVGARVTWSGDNVTVRAVDRVAKRTPDGLPVYLVRATYDGAGSFKRDRSTPADAPRDGCAYWYNTAHGTVDNASKVIDDVPATTLAAEADLPELERLDTPDGVIAVLRRLGVLTPTLERYILDQTVRAALDEAVATVRPQVESERTAERGVPDMVLRDSTIPAEADQLRREREAVRELRKYVRHFQSCNNVLWGHPCDCGLAAVLDRVGGASEAPTERADGAEDR